MAVEAKHARLSSAGADAGGSDGARPAEVAPRLPDSSKELLRRLAEELLLLNGQAQAAEARAEAAERRAGQLATALEAAEAEARSLRQQLLALQRRQAAQEPSGDEQAAAGQARQQPPRQQQQQQQREKTPRQPQQAEQQQQQTRHVARQAGADAGADRQVTPATAAVQRLTQLAHGGMSQQRKRAADGMARALAPKQARRDAGTPAGALLGPIDGAVDAAGTLQRNLRRVAAPPPSRPPSEAPSALPSPTDTDAGLLLSLREQRVAGRRRRGPLQANVALKAGETAQQWLNRCAAAYVGVLLQDRDFRSYFGAPVPLDTPEYCQVVSRPMDLGTVKAMAVRGQYDAPQQLLADLHVVAANARLYNESPKHPVHAAAVRLQEALDKPDTFTARLPALFRSAAAAAAAAAREAEAAAVERRLASEVAAGLNVAVFARDDVRGNLYYLMRAAGPVETLAADETDDFGFAARKGDRVVRGCYYDYWGDAKGGWDSASRPYFYDDGPQALAPAAALLAVGFPLRQRPQLEVSPLSGTQHAVFEVPPAVHQDIKAAIAKLA